MRPSMCLKKTAQFIAGDSEINEYLTDASHRIGTYTKHAPEPSREYVAEYSLNLEKINLSGTNRTCLFSGFYGTILALWRARFVPGKVHSRMRVSK